MLLALKPSTPKSQRHPYLLPKLFSEDCSRDSKNRNVSKFVFFSFQVSLARNAGIDENFGEFVFVQLIRHPPLRCCFQNIENSTSAVVALDLKWGFYPKCFFYGPSSFSHLGALGRVAAGCFWLQQKLA